MKRIAFFAHYDRDNVVDDYVIYYLRGLKSVADRILFVSDCNLPQAELDKLRGLVKIVYADRHREYDFGSWKRCFEHVGYDLGEWDEIILANDSCYAPVFPFGPVFDHMQNVECDFWSPTANKMHGKVDHLSSYFLVFRRPVLGDSTFLDFWRAIVPQPNAQAVIELYETGLTRLVIGLGYLWGSYLPAVDIGSFLKIEYVRRMLPRYKVPWLKVRLVRDNPSRGAKLGECLSRITQCYPRNLIDAHMRRMTGTDRPPHYHYKRLIVENYTVRIPYVFAFSSKVKRNKKRTSLLWWKVYVYFFSLPVFALAVPLFWKVENGPRNNSNIAGSA